MTRSKPRLPSKPFSMPLSSSAREEIWLILARATNTGALPVLSFDRRFAASDGVELLRSS